ncbi:MAG: cobalamin-independent methionine synthase II family protein [Trebonia sp.]
MGEPRAETVGSLLRSPAVLRAARRSSLADGFVLDEAALDAIKLQEEIGLDVITDGELRRTSWAQTPRFLDAFTQVTGRGALNWRGGTPVAPVSATDRGPEASATLRGYPAVVRRVATAPRIGDVTAEYAFLARHARTGTRTKFTMPAPSYHRRFWSEEHSRAVYGSCEEYLAEMRDYLREVVDRLIEFGCDYIQLDAPNYGSYCDPDTHARLVAEGRDPQADLAFDASLDNSLFAGLPPEVATALHICRGNGPRGMWHSAGGYAAISGTLFPALGFSRLLLEYDSDRAGGFEPLAEVKPGTVVVLGLLTTKFNLPDDEDHIADRIGEAAARKPLGELALSTQCGFASAPGSNPVTPSVQRAKLEMVVRLARRFWPS